ncbi:MAG: (Fe-S)-binding protein [Gammaproteobacteria bacterium]
MKTILDWSIYRDAGMGDAYADIPKTGGDFARAVSVCINSQQCEVTHKGVMCPSFRVTGYPAFSTGGRIRLLKAALNGGLGEKPLEDEKLATAMDLCVACKGCKRECENEVDMAMIKVEYLAQQYQQQRVPWRNKFMANLSYNLQYYSCFTKLAKLRNRFKFLSALSERLLGISRNRKIPVPFKKTFTKKHRKALSFLPNKLEQYHSEVVLLIDTFTDNFAPQHARDAISLLNQAGYKVIITQPTLETIEPLRPLCCGRTHIANGLVNEAKYEAQRMLSVLHPHVQAGRTIIGLEPACLLAIRDDYKFLGLGQMAEQVANSALLFEEFVAREVTAKRFKVKFNAINTGDKPLMVHGHCHQKAVGAMKSMRKLLKLIPDLDFKLIDSTCCGMAGSFGIEKEHAELAMSMAEESLLPALRENNESRIVANGFSCRHQIKEGVDRQAIHIATLLREATA